MNIYDRVVEAVIMCSVLAEAYISWKLLQRKQQQRITRQFKRIMARMGL